MAKCDVYWNHSEHPIFISRGILPDPLGGSADFAERIIIAPGDGIDLAILGLSNHPPKKDKPEHCVCKRPKYLTDETYCFKCHRPSERVLEMPEDGSKTSIKGEEPKQ